MDKIIILTTLIFLCSQCIFAITIAKTKYESDGVPIANVVADSGVGVIPDGRTDCTRGLQKAIDKCYKSGGGTVFLPAGKYLITSRISIPEGVVLKGDWQDPVNNPRPEYGTVIIADPQPLAENEIQNTMAKPLITVSGNSGIIGITVFYPKQSAEKPIPYGFTVQMEPNEGSNVSCSTLRRITLINSYRGISAEYKHELCQLEKIRVCGLDKGVYMGFSTDVGYTTDLRISPDFWIHAGEYSVSSPAELKTYCRENTEGLVLEWLDDETLSEIYIDGCKIGIHFMDKQFWGLLYDVHIKNCTTGILCENLNDWAGAVISRGEIEASEDAVICKSRVGMLKLSGMKIKGKVSGRRYKIDNTPLPDIPVSHGTYKKPKNILYVPETAGMSQKPADISSRLQTALDKAGKTGGVVYLPAGIFSLYKPVTVPEGVQLCGSAPIFIKDTESYCGGTIILTYVNKGASITLNKDAGVNGIRMLYPCFDPVNARKYIDAGSEETKSVGIKGTGSGVYVTNSVITAAFTGIDFTGCDNHFIRQVFGVSYLSQITAGGKQGRIEGVLANIHFTQRHCLTQYFDPEYANPKLNWMSLGAYIRDMVVRQFCSTFRLIDDDDEQILNVFMYAPNHLLTADNSSAELLNISSDFMYGYQLLSENNSKLTVINSLRSCGGSIICDDSSAAKIYNRIAISYQTEENYDSAKTKTDKYSYTQKVPITGCGTLEGVEYAELTDNPEYTKEGKGWLNKADKENTENWGNIVIARLPETDISSCYPGGRLHMTIYVNDYHNLIWGSQIQITSSGKQDNQSLGWSLPVYILHKGKNEIYLPFDSANPNSTGGDFDPSKLNFLRIFAYYGADYDNIFAISDIYVCK